MRFIFARCMKHQLSSKLIFKESKWTDLMFIMKSVKPVPSLNKVGKLDDWTVFLFGDGKLQLPDSLARMYADYRIDEIIEYNKQDLKLTFNLWQRIQQTIGNST